MSFRTQENVQSEDAEAVFARMPKEFLGEQQPYVDDSFEAPFFRGTSRRLFQSESQPLTQIILKRALRQE